MFINDYSRKNTLVCLLYSETIFHYLFQMCWFFRLSDNSVTPAECPTIQLNSDTIFLELASDPMG